RRALQLDVDGERRVDLRQLGGRELDVDHGTDHPHHATVHMSVLLGHPAHSFDVWARASAPPTISLISVVISSCRARFACLVRILMSSSALSVAAFIARRRAAFSDAADSSNAA